MKKLFIYFALLFLSITGVHAGGSQYYVEGYVTNVSNDETVISINAFCGKNLTTTNKSSLKNNTECLEKYTRNKTMLQIVENYKATLPENSPVKKLIEKISLYFMSDPSINITFKRNTNTSFNSDNNANECTLDKLSDPIICNKEGLIKLLSRTTIKKGDYVEAYLNETEDLLSGKAVASSIKSFEKKSWIGQVLSMENGELVLVGDHFANTFSVDAYAKVSDSNNNTIKLNDIVANRDVIEVSSSTASPLIITNIKVLGRISSQGEKVNIMCSYNTEPVYISTNEEKAYCLKLNDEICSTNETAAISFNDCAKTGETYSNSFWKSPSQIDTKNKFFVIDGIKFYFDDSLKYGFSYSMNTTSLEYILNYNWTKNITGDVISKNNEKAVFVKEIILYAQ
ncbi:MAG: hypothetical protein WCX74_03345 [Candidatus Paceibacterota bacterium]